MSRSSDDPTPAKPGLSRRNFLSRTAAATGAVGAFSFAGAPGASAQADDETVVDASALVAISLTVNGRARQLSVAPRTTLVEALRDTLGLTGTKIGCNHGQCGACTVLLDGRRINSCLTLAMTADGSDVTTIEGLSEENVALHPMQVAFTEHDAYQCGYCTPGQILSAVGCIEEGHANSPDEIREYMSGNLCRCGAYPNIVAAIEDVKRQQGS
ncbi:MAG: (2Fe-2S)-binding protein [Pseudomonadota bacterium]